MKKVLIINGSPTPKGNTNALIEAFVRGAEGAGNLVNRCDVRSMNIHPCVGCMAGGRDPQHPCSQIDDMDIIYRYMEDADVVVWAAPLYWWTLPAQMKMVIDRMYAMMEVPPADGAPAYKPIPCKTLMLLMPAEEAHEKNFQLINQYFDGYIERMGWQDGGRLMVGELLFHKDYEGKPEALAKAETLGASIK